MAATLALMAWGTLAFGGNYPWAYYPLLVGAAILGIAGIVAPSAQARVPWAVLAGLLLVAAAALVQLIPLTQPLLQQLSPATHRFLREYHVAYAVGAASGSASHTLSIEPGSTWLALACLASFGLLFVGTIGMLTRESLRALVAGIATLGVLLSIIGIVQKAMWNGKIYGVWQTLMGGLPFGPFVNRNHFAGWMLMMLPLTLGLLAALVYRAMDGVAATARDRVIWFSSPEASRMILLMAAAAVMTLALVLTFSRSAMIGLVVGLVVPVTVLLTRTNGGVRRTVTLALFALMPIAVGGWVGIDAIAARFGANTLAESRLPIWHDAWRVASAFFPFGSGLNTFGYAMLEYQSQLTFQHLREAHNDYLQLAAEGGLLLGVPLIVTLTLFVREVRRRFAEGADAGTSYWVRIGAVAGLTAIAVQSAADFSLQMPGNAASFAVLAAIALHHADPAV